MSQQIENKDMYRDWLLHELVSGQCNLSKEDPLYTKVSQDTQAYLEI